MLKEDCIFCKIVKGEIPSHTVYEDEEFKVILDIEPATKGHSLIIPKSHATNLFELDDAVAAKVLPVAKKVGFALSSALQCNGLNVLQNNGEVAGQTVHHFHMHLIPRYEKDDVAFGYKHGSIDADTVADFLSDVKGRI